MTAAATSLRDVRFGRRDVTMYPPRLTDKLDGEGAVLKNRAALMVDLYSLHPSARVISIQKGV